MAGRALWEEATQIGAQNSQFTTLNEDWYQHY